MSNEYYSYKIEEAKEKARNSLLWDFVHMPLSYLKNPIYMDFFHRERLESLPERFKPTVNLLKRNKLANQNRYFDSIRRSLPILFLLGMALIIIGVLAILFKGGFGLLGATLSFWLMGVGAIFLGTIFVLSSFNHFQFGRSLQAYKGQITGPIFGLCIGIILSIAFPNIHQVIEVPVYPGSSADILVALCALIGYVFGFIFDFFLKEKLTNLSKRIFSLIINTCFAIIDTYEDMPSTFREFPIRTLLILVLTAIALYFTTVNEIIFSYSETVAQEIFIFTIISIGVIYFAQRLDGFAKNKEEALFIMLEDFEIKDIKINFSKLITRIPKDIKFILKFLRHPISTMSALSQIFMVAGKREISKIIVGVLSVYLWYLEEIGVIIANIIGATYGTVPVIETFTFYLVWHLSRFIFEIQILDRFMVQRTVAKFLQVDTLNDDLNIEQLENRLEYYRSNRKQKLAKLDDVIESQINIINNSSERKLHLSEMLNVLEEVHQNLLDQRVALLKEGGNDKEEQKALKEEIQSLRVQIKNESKVNMKKLIDFHKSIKNLLQNNLKLREESRQKMSKLQKCYILLDTPEALMRSWLSAPDYFKVQYEKLAQAEMDNFLMTFPDKLKEYCFKAHLTENVRQNLLARFQNEIALYQAFKDKDQTFINGCLMKLQNPKASTLEKETELKLFTNVFQGYSQTLNYAMYHIQKRFFECLYKQLDSIEDDKLYCLNDSQLNALSQLDIQIEEKNNDIQLLNKSLAMQEMSDGQMQDMYSIRLKNATTKLNKAKLKRTQCLKDLKRVDWLDDGLEHIRVLLSEVDTVAQKTKATVAWRTTQDEQENIDLAVNHESSSFSSMGLGGFNASLIAQRNSLDVPKDDD